MSSIVPSRTALVSAILLLGLGALPGSLAAQVELSKSGYNSSASETAIIRGAVVLENGSPPPLGVAIEQDCGEGFIKETETTPSGSFVFQARESSRGCNSFPGSMQCSDGDGGFLSKMGSAQIPQQGSIEYQSFSGTPAGCELRASYPGYRSNTIRLANDRRPHDIGTITLHVNAKSRGKFVSVTSLHVPKKARKKLDAAVSSFKRKNLVEAEDDLKAALDEYPQYAEAWYWLGWLYEQQKRVPEARGSYEKAVGADRTYVQPYLGLAEVAAMEQVWQEMENFSAHALQLDSLNFPEAYVLNAVANFRLRKFDAAEKSARKAEQMDSSDRNPKIHLLLADVLYSKADLAGSVQELRAYLHIAPKAADVEAVRALLQEREKQE